MGDSLGSRLEGSGCFSMTCCNKVRASKKILIVTTSGGGGHLQAAQAKVQEAQNLDPNAKIVQFDVLRTCVGNLFGRFMVNIWDVNQRKGNVKALEFWSSAVPIFDVIFWIPVFFKVTYLLLRNRLNLVIDTQPLCLHSIVTAVRFAKWITNKDIQIEKVLTELPTNYIAHFLRPIKRLRIKHRQLVKLISTHPLVEENETADCFWKKYSGLSETRIEYTDFPIRPSFKKYQAKKRTQEPFIINVKLKDDNEESLLRKTLAVANSQAVFQDGKLSLNIEHQDSVVTLMLGSQPTHSATLSYVENFIESVSRYGKPQTNYFLFVFCSKKLFEKPCLQMLIQKMIEKKNNYPNNLTIIPMSPQGDEVIAPLYFRSDLTLTRSGGVTSMELMTVASGQIWIHKENSPSILEKYLPNKGLFAILNNKGMPRWEYGNATYLEAKKGAQIITPDLFVEASKELLSSE